jgi:purine-binding chemotaxis protein CheW
MPEIEYNQFTVVIVLEVNGKIIGIIADAVSDVISLTHEDMQEIPEFNKLSADYLKGMGRYGTKMILMLDIDKILTFEEYKSFSGTAQDN